MGQVRGAAHALGGDDMSLCSRFTGRAYTLLREVAARTSDRGAPGGRYESAYSAARARLSSGLQRSLGRQ